MDPGDPGDPGSPGDHVLFDPTDLELTKQEANEL